MASRQVCLLTKGYLLGWLNFEYPNRLSYVREQFIIRELERELIREITGTQAQMNASLVSNAVVGNKKAFDLPMESMERYIELTLPYTAKKPKIDKDIGFADRDYWVKLLKEKNQKQPTTPTK